MKFGLSYFATDYGMSIVDLAREAEQRGFDSIFLAEHTHIPASRLSPWPGGAELPQEYWHSLDPFVALAAAASVTTRLKLGTGVCLVIERDPITLAKEVATLDHLSNGRVLFGVGGGWNREEMENHGTDFTQRWSLLRERVEAMKAIWTQDEASFAGRWTNFDRIRQWPKPVQQPYPPILIGGDGERTLRRVVAYGDEWMPIAARMPPGRLAERGAELNRMAAAKGRGPIPVSAFGVRADPAAVEQLASEGVTRCIFSLPAAEPERVMRALERAEAAMAGFPQQV